MGYRFEMEGLEVVITCLEPQGWAVNAANGVFQLFGIYEGEGDPQWIYNRLRDTPLGTFSREITASGQLDGVVQNLLVAGIPQGMRSVADICTNEAHACAIRSAADSLEGYWREYGRRRGFSAELH